MDPAIEAEIAWRKKLVATATGAELRKQEVLLSQALYRRSAFNANVQWLKDNAGRGPEALARSSSAGMCNNISWYLLEVASGRVNRDTSFASWYYEQLRAGWITIGSTRADLNRGIPSYTGLMLGKSADLKYDSYAARYPARDLEAVPFVNHPPMTAQAIQAFQDSGARVAMAYIEREGHYFPITRGADRSRTRPPGATPSPRSRVRSAP